MPQGDRDTFLGKRDRETVGCQETPRHKKTTDIQEMAASCSNTKRVSFEEMMLRRAGPSTGTLTTPFRKQAQAMKQCRVSGGIALSQDLACGQGRKQFYSASLVDACKLVNQSDIDDRAFYEIIAEGWPCHMHIDCEHYYATNPQTPDLKSFEVIEKMALSSLLEFTCDWFGGIPESYVQVVVLDSSNETKASRHYILRIKGIMFADNYQVGAFIRNFELKVAGIPSASSPWYTWNTKAKPGDDAWKMMSFIFDMVIWTKNRNFRTVQSSKRGHRRPLKVLRPEGTTEGSIEEFRICSVLWPEPLKGKTNILLVYVNEPCGKPAYSNAKPDYHRLHLHPNATRHCQGALSVAKFKVASVSRPSSKETPVANQPRRALASALYSEALKDLRQAAGPVSSSIPVQTESSIRKSTAFLDEGRFSVDLTTKVCPLLVHKSAEAQSGRGVRCTHTNNNTGLVLDMSDQKHPMYRWTCFHEGHSSLLFKWAPVKSNLVMECISRLFKSANRAGYCAKEIDICKEILVKIEMLSVEQALDF